MKNYAPGIYRQRLVIEGIYTRKITPQALKIFMKSLSRHVKMQIIYGPIIMNLAERINPIHKGYEGVMIWAESGTSVYTWENKKFFTVDIYTCKKFSAPIAVKFVKKFFKATKITSKNV